MQLQIAPMNGVTMVQIVWTAPPSSSAAICDTASSRVTVSRPAVGGAPNEAGSRPWNQGSAE